MSSLLAALAVIHILGFLIFLVAIRRAPFGHEDERGYHEHRD